MNIWDIVVILFLCVPGLVAIVVWLRTKTMINRELSKLRKGGTP